MKRTIKCIFWILTSISAFLYIPLLLSNNIACSLLGLCEFLLHSEKMLLASFIFIFLLPVFWNKDLAWAKISLIFSVILLLNLILREDTYNDYLKLGPVPTGIYIYILFILIMIYNFLTCKNR